MAARNRGQSTAEKLLGLIKIEHLNRPQEGAAHLERALAFNPRITGHAHMREIIDEIRKGM